MQMKIYKFDGTDTDSDLQIQICLAQTWIQIYRYKSVWLRQGFRFTDTNPFGSDRDSDSQIQIRLAQTGIQIFRY